MIPVGAFAVAADHPSLPGHFPGAPVVPGVVLIDHALALILPMLPGWRLRGLESVKFLAPVLPDQRITVTCTPPVADRMAFACDRDGRVVLRGQALLGRPAPDDAAPGRA